jgi:hypothetical protein
MSGSSIQRSYGAQRGMNRGDRLSSPPASCAGHPTSKTRYHRRVRAGLVPGDLLTGLRKIGWCAVHIESEYSTPDGGYVAV